MIHEVYTALKAELAEKGVPLPLVEGPERTKQATYASERIIFEEDDVDASFSRPPTMSPSNPPRRFVLASPIKVTVHAQSKAAGAKYFEHCRRARAAAKQVVIALEKVIATKKLQWTLPTMRPAPPADLAQSEVAAGATYEIRFALTEGVSDVTWPQEAAPEATVGGENGVTINSTTTVGAAEETGCGDP